MKLEDLRLFTLYSDSYTSLHSMALKLELAEGSSGKGLSTPDGLPHVELGTLEIDIHRWKGVAGTDSEIEALGCPSMENVYAYLESHPEAFQHPDDEDEEGDEDEDDEGNVWVNGDHPAVLDGNAEYDAQRAADGLPAYRLLDD